MFRLSTEYRYNRNVWLLCSASALGSGAFLGVRQLLNALYALRLGFGPEWVGTLFATGALAFSLSSLCGGALGTRLGPRRTMLLGVGINIVGMALLPLTQAMPEAWRFPWLIASQIVSSGGWALYVVNTPATMAAFTTVSNRRGAFALREACSGAGVLLGSFVGGLLPGFIAHLSGTSTDLAGPYGHALWASVIVGSLTLVPVFLLAPPAVITRAQAKRTPFRVGWALVLLVACAFANNASHAACKAYASVYMDVVHRLPTSLIGTITSVGMLTSIVAALSSSWFARRLNSRQVMRLGALGIAGSLLVMALVPHWLGTAVGLIGVYGLLGMWRPAYSATQMDMAPPAWRSLVSGTCSMGMSLGFGSLSYGGGYLVTHMGYPWVFAAGAVMALLSSLMAVLLGRSMGHEIIDTQMEAPRAITSPTADSATPAS